MKITILRGIGLAAALLLASCGDSTGPAADRNSGGTGSGTLSVKADVDATDVAGGLVTDFVVEVRDGLNDPVSGALVTITNSTFSVITLLEDPGTGDYEATRNSFPSGDFELSVVAANGTDRVEGVVLGGPGVHTITAPLANTTVLSSEPLTITWTAPSQAVSAEVETLDFGPALVPDNGTYVISIANNDPNGAQRIRVFRFNEVAIAGGLIGSRMEVEVRQTVEPVIVQ